MTINVLLTEKLIQVLINALESCNVEESEKKMSGICPFIWIRTDRKWHLFWSESTLYPTSVEVRESIFGVRNKPTKQSTETGVNTIS